MFNHTRAHGMPRKGEKYGKQSKSDPVRAASGRKPRVPSYPIDIQTRMDKGRLPGQIRAPKGMRFTNLSQIRLTMADLGAAVLEGAIEPTVAKTAITCFEKAGEVMLAELQLGPNIEVPLSDGVEEQMEKLRHPGESVAIQVIAELAGVDEQELLEFDGG